MSQRVQKLGAAYSDRPFEGEGVSLYVSAGARVQYRHIRVLPGGKRRRGRRHQVKGTGGGYDLAAGISKTARVDSATGTTGQVQIQYTLPAALAGETLAIDVRHYRDDVENQTDNFRTHRVEVDGSLAPVTAILGTATLLSQEPRAGGVVRLRLAYQPHRDGTQPTVFRAKRTAGPTSPADATVTVPEGTRLVEIDTPQLSDASPYTYTIRAENAGGTVTLDLLTGITVTADATGPPAPTNGSAEAW